jgi:Protein of unknown function (DUF1553)/Protein of unknown function (DUF1549)/Planctomycete cytochrome C
MIRLAPPCGFIALLLGFFTGASVSAAPPDKIRFNEHIRPLLSGNCFYCHGPDLKHREADLRLDTREGATADLGGYAAIVPGKPDESTLLNRVSSTDPDEFMPPPASKKPHLMPDQIELLRRWIEQGAEYEGHWAFLPLAHAQPPAVKNESWIANPIDRFILARLEHENLAPSPPADPATLIRRVSIDLTGLLPTPEEVEEFVRSYHSPLTTHHSPSDAYIALVNRLLASPHYGERWGRHWLDQARYADSNGYSIDSERQMWPYRDWVIKALNDDLPFDQFTVEQLAGDLLPNATKSQLIATAFHRNTLINEEGGTDKDQFRHEAVVDRVNTTGAVWLGLTVGCCQCHTHKFDPLEHREYYQLFAFFNNGTDINNRGATIPVVRGEVFGRPVAVPKPTVPDPEQLASAEAAWEKRELARLEKLEPRAAPDESLLAALRASSGDRSPEQAKLVSEAFAKSASDAAATGGRRMARANPDVADLMVWKELEQPRDTYLFLRGDFLRPDKELGLLMPDVPAAVGPKLPPAETRNRLDLARWLVHPENPLTPRVQMNRVWMRYFGRGLVETDEDFGTQGTPPSHPELLDWLASEWIRRGWSIKEMHQLIVTSSTYRQSSHFRPDLKEKDPRNLLLARQERIRFDAEIVRDAALSACGLLDRTIGGPSVKPPQPEGVYAFTQTAKRWTADTGPARNRRAMYTLFFRSAPHPLFTTFDAPDFQTVCTRRGRSNTPLQALTVANDEVFLEFSQALAARVLRETPAGNIDARITRAFLLALCRQPSPSELSTLRAYYDRQLNDLTTDLDRAKSLLSPDLIAATDIPAVGRGSPDSAHTAALILVSRAIFNTDGFITRE